MEESMGMLSMFAGVGMVGLLIIFAIQILMLVSMWKIYTKAGKPGWANLIPIYNFIVLLEIVEKPIWWFILLLVPFVNFIVGIIVILELTKKFGKSGGFAAGIILLPVIFIPVLGFGKAEYQGASPAAA